MKVKDKELDPRMLRNVLNKEVDPNRSRTDRELHNAIAHLISTGYAQKWERGEIKNSELIYRINVFFNQMGRMNPARDSKIKDSIKFLGVSVEFSENGKLGSMEGKVMPVETLNQLLLREDKNVAEENKKTGRGGYDKTWVDFHFDVNGKKKKINIKNVGWRKELGTGRDIAITRNEIVAAEKLAIKDVKFAMKDSEKALKDNKTFKVKVGDKTYKVTAKDGDTAHKIVQAKLKDDNVLTQISSSEKMLGELKNLYRKALSTKNMDELENVYGQLKSTQDNLYRAVNGLTGGASSTLDENIKKHSRVLRGR